MLHFDEIVFGPVFSRRLGSSLGVNVLPSVGKLCNFDCVYCECGWNRDGIAQGRFPDAAAVEEALEYRMKSLAEEGVGIDSVTFSGNGEPTLNPDFATIVDITIRLRDRYFPSARISVLSNATLVGRKDVADALKRVDNPILKLDAGDDLLIRKMNRPCGNFSLSALVEGLKSFDGNFILQTMFLRSPDFDTTEALAGWMDIVREVRPRQIMVYTIDRETPDGRLGKYTVEEMTGFVRPLLEEGFDIQIKG